MVEKRNIVPGQTKYTIEYPLNYIDNRKYSVLTFLPRSLYEQFQQFNNIYFLAITISQFFDILKVGYFITYAGPLALVVVLAIIKELVEDCARYYRDKNVNDSPVVYWNTVNKTWDLKVCADLQVGDIIQIKDKVPADCLVINTLNDEEDFFVRTDQLDGETDWKQKRAIRTTFNLMKMDDNNKGRESFFYQENMQKYSFECEKPSIGIYNFSGRLTYQTMEGKTKHEGVDIDNCVWANSKVTSGTVEAVVIYTGSETKMQMNMTSARFKLGKIDHEIDMLMKVTVSLMVFLGFIMVVSKGFSKYSPIFLCRYILLFSYMIPISTKINIDVAKIYYCYCINNDDEILGTTARNFNIPEELSRVNYIFTDKTGTLTKNEMILKKLYVFNSVEIDCEDNIILESVKDMLSKSDRYPFEVCKNPSKTTMLKRAICAMACCNNVTPSSSDDKRVLQASSPDEIAFVSYTDEIGYFMNKRTNHYIEYTDQHLNETDHWTIKMVIPFRSETKKMRIFLQNSCNSDQIVLYVKGAESEIAKLISINESQWMNYKCKEISKLGLRTLAFCHKTISVKEYEEFKDNFDSSYPDQKEQYTQRIEKNCELSCISGVEDKLQDGVAETIASLKQANINIWMLTGDKIETAKCIASSTDLKGFDQEFATFSALYYVKDNTISSSFINDLVKREMNIRKTVLVFDGDMLHFTLKFKEYRTIFFKLAAKAQAVMICRCSPTQKAEVVKNMILETGCMSLSIGDGGNDVAMITEAHVGIGIFGKEGMQAALSSDFSITEFKHLKKLLFWHGRNSYKRTSALAQFIIHRGMLITFVQMCFSLAFFNSPVSLYNGYLMIGFSTIFTTLPILAVVLDEDVDPEYAINYPILYKNLFLSRDLSFKSWMIWVWQSTYQGCVVIILSILLFRNSYLYMVSISFTSIIACEWLNVRTTVRKWHRYMTYCILGSLVIYALTIYLLDTIFENQFIVDEAFMLNLFYMICVAWLPIWLIQYIRTCIYPSDVDKLEKANTERQMNENELIKRHENMYSTTQKGLLAEMNLSNTNRNGNSNREENNNGTPRQVESSVNLNVDSAVRYQSKHDKLNNPYETDKDNNNHYHINDITNKNDINNKNDYTNNMEYEIKDQKKSDSQDILNVNN